MKEKEAKAKDYNFHLKEIDRHSKSQLYYLPAKSQEVKDIVHPCCIFNVPTINIQSILDLTDIGLMVDLQSVYIGIGHPHHVAQYIVEI